jgi:hypothetical protein
VRLHGKGVVKSDTASDEGAVGGSEVAPLLQESERVSPLRWQQPPSCCCVEFGGAEHGCPAPRSGGKPSQTAIRDVSRDDVILARLSEVPRRNPVTPRTALTHKSSLAWCLGTPSCDGVHEGIDWSAPLPIQCTGRAQDPANNDDHCKTDLAALAAVPGLPCQELCPLSASSVWRGVARNMKFRVQLPRLDSFPIFRGCSQQIEHRRGPRTVARYATARAVEGQRV